jgi:hypothetical protein
VPDATLGELVDDLDARRDPNRTLTVSSFERRPIRVAATVVVTPDRAPADVSAAVADALVESFAFERVSFGDAVHLSAVYATIQTVPGVAGTEVTLLDLLDAAESAARGLTHGANSHLPVLANELPTLERTDVAITVAAELAP